jgi:hypothetical protein
MPSNPSGGGSTDPTTGDHIYADGATVNLTATPNIGYVFSSWSGGVTGSTNPTSVTMSADKTVTANFTAQNYDLTMAVSPSGAGTTSPGAGAHSYGVNTVVNISATPASGYAFDHWTGDVASTTSASTTVTVSAAKTVTAVFVVVNHTLTMAVSPSSCGTTNPAVGGHSYAEGTIVDITATPATGYAFANWSGAVTGSTNPTTVTMSADKTVTANFTVRTFTLTYSAGTGGHLTGTLSQTVNYSASGSAVTAVADTGYHFVKWSDNATANPRTDTNVTANLTVSAQFALDSHSLSLEAGWNLVAGAPGTEFPGVLFSWNGTGYTSVNEPTAWQGFWCQVDQDQSVGIQTLAGPHTIDLSVGWNLIGNCMATAATLQLPSGIAAWVYDPAGGFTSVTTLQPGQGAWVKGTASGQQVTLTGS